jgi:hypothetical protein
LVWSGAAAAATSHFPRANSVNGERRSFALLRPIADATAQDRLRDLILQAIASTKSSW